MALAPLFFRRAVCCFLVYDVCNFESFKNLDRWYEQLLKNTDSKILIFLLGNKKDKPNREVPYNVGMNYAMQKNFGFMEVSAKTGFGVRQAFDSIISEVYKLQMMSQTDSKPLS